jgi:hypothetical protein
MHPFIDAGVVGNYGNAGIFVHNTSSGVITGIQDVNNNYVSDAQLQTLNATEGLKVIAVIAWPTRILFVDVVSAENNSQSGSNSR